MRRLWDSCRVYRMDLPYTLEQLNEAVLETIRANDFKSCYIRPLVYRGYSQLGVNPMPCPVEVAVIVWEWDAYLGDDALAKGVDVGVSSWTRIAPNTFPAMAKATANYANSGLIKMQATVDGYAEGIALDESGLLSEGSGQNLFLVRDSVVYTPSLTSSILQGITRDTVLTLTRDLGFEVARTSRCRASFCTWPTKRSSAAPRSRSRRSARSTRSRSATAGVDRSPRHCRSASSASSKATCPMSTTGSRRLAPRSPQSERGRQSTAEAGGRPGASDVHLKAGQLRYGPRAWPSRADRAEQQAGP